MSTQTPTIYVPRSIAREKTFQNGGSILSVSFHAESLLAFIREHTNDRGYFNITIRKRREVGKHDETHSVCLDTWTPKAGVQQMRQAVQATQVTMSSPRSARDATPEEQTDVPF